MITVVHHSADYDGLFSARIAEKFLPEAVLIGWDFGQPLVQFPEQGVVYLIDLPPDCFGVISDEQMKRLIWIDHHNSSIQKWAGFDIEGLRIDGVAACRLAWQWFKHGTLARNYSKEEFRSRIVDEPMAITLAGEYDVWEHENSHEVDITFQFGLDAMGSQLNWGKLLTTGCIGDEYCHEVLEAGAPAQAFAAKRVADIITKRGFDLEFEGLKFRALNTAKCNSQDFLAAIRPEHDGCLGFYWDGKQFMVSMYGVPHKPEIDLSKIAVKYGGGGHKQACGFPAKTLPWIK